MGVGVTLSSVSVHLGVSLPQSLSSCVPLLNGAGSGCGLNSIAWGFCLKPQPHCKRQAFCLRLRQRQCWVDVWEVLLFFTFKTIWRIFQEANVGSDFNPRMWLWTSSGISWDTVAEISLLGSANYGRQDYWCRLGWKRDIGFPISHESPSLPNPSLITPNPHELPWNSCIIK